MTQVVPEHIILRVVSLVEDAYAWVQRTPVSFLPIIKPPVATGEIILFRFPNASSSAIQSAAFS